MKKQPSFDTESERHQIEDCMCELFESARDIYVDTSLHECEVTVSENDFTGQFENDLFFGGYRFTMVDFSDVKPYKYVFSYQREQAS